jgi:hypothetical protein
MGLGHLVMTGGLSGRERQSQHLFEQCDMGHFPDVPGNKLLARSCSFAGEKFENRFAELCMAFPSASVPVQTT